MQVFDHASKGVREAPTKVLIGQLAERAGESPAAAFSELPGCPIHLLGDCL